MCSRPLETTTRRTSLREPARRSVARSVSKSSSISTSVSKSVPISVVLSALAPALALVLAGCTSTGAPYGSGGFATSIGGRFLLDEIWDEADEQYALGAEVDWTPPEWPVGFEAAFHATSTGTNWDSGDLDGEVQELSLGLRKTFGPDRAPLSGAEPFGYVGGGGAWFRAEQSDFDVLSLRRRTDRDDGFGVYAHGGIGARFARGAVVGFDLRWVAGEVDLFDESGKVDAIQPSVFLGVRW